MFKYQDLLYTEQVAPTWYSPFTEYAMVLLSAINHDVKLGKLDSDKAMKFTQGFINFCQALENNLFSGNKKFMRTFMNIMERNDVPPLPVQYDISEFLDEKNDKFKSVIEDWKDKTHRLIDENMTEEGTVPAERLLQDGQTAFVSASQNQYETLLNSVDDLRKEFVELLHEHQLFFAKPRHDNLWVYCGVIDDPNYPDTHQSIQTFVYTKEAWGHAVFDRQYAKDNKFVLDDDEFVVSFRFFSKYDGNKGEATYDDGYANVHFDKNHMPIDMFTHFKDDDTMYNAFGKTFTMYQETIGNHLLTNQYQVDEAVKKVIAYVYKELGYNFIRTYMLLDVFTLLNTRSNVLPSGENVIVEKSSGHLNKKVKKRFASKYKKKIDNLENFFVVKELIINPFLTRNSEQSGFKEGDTLNKLREHIRAGHYKVYTADKPRFGKPHKNNIGRFWYKPSTINKGSSKGVVLKDYKVGVE